MTVGVYTRFWNTAGGGEVYAGTLADVLSRSHDVELLSEEAIDFDRLDDRLGLDLRRLPIRVLGEVSDAEFARATASYDLFVNCSHGSRRPNGARHGVYVVHFPPEADTAVVRHRFLRSLSKRITRDVHYEWIEGVYPEERDGDRSWRWTKGMARLAVTLPEGRRARVDLLVSMAARPHGAEAPFVVAVDGNVVAERAFRRQGPELVTLPIVGHGATTEVSITTIPFAPTSFGAVHDERLLGVQIEGISVRCNDLVARVVSWAIPSVSTVMPDSFFDTYGTIIANSAFTATWLRRRWGRPSIVIEPPVRLRAPAPVKKPIILNVGRFFAPANGHSKRQLELVQAFGRAGPSMPGWELHLVGGCAPEHEAYLREVEAAAAGQPVRLHVNAAGHELDELYRMAAIYWHATGLGEDSRSHPERFEHFGISVVEAMSAGAVPVVLGLGGPAEIVRDGKDGFHFASTAELVERTRLLVEDGDQRACLAASAVERAAGYGVEQFADKIDRLLPASV